jgi:hypothetical protein
VPAVCTFTVTARVDFTVTGSDYASVVAAVQRKVLEALVPDPPRVGLPRVRSVSLASVHAEQR